MSPICGSGLCVHHWKHALGLNDMQLDSDFNMLEKLTQPVNWPLKLVIHGSGPDLWAQFHIIQGNKQKQNWKIDTSLGAIGAQNVFFSLYKLGVNFLWIREILKMYISPSFSNRKKVQYYRFCIFKGVSKLNLMHSTGHKSLKNGSKSNNLGSLIKFRKFLAR